MINKNHQSSIHTKFITGKKDIVFIGLNATAAAVQVQSVFCTRAGFWNILRDAGFISNFKKDTKLQYPYQHMAHEVFVTGSLVMCKESLGFTDIVDNSAITTTNSSQVIVTAAHLKSLENRISSCSPNKIVLLGKRIAEEFVKIDPKLAAIFKQKKNSPNAQCYDYLGDTLIGGKLTKVYVMPFPETSPIKDKAGFYKKI
jgi:hypothetical protein